MDADSETRTLTALLDWYREMGVDTAVSDDAVDWLSRGDLPPASAAAIARPPSAAADRPLPPQVTARVEPTTRPSASPGVKADHQPPPRPGFANTPPDAAELGARAAAAKAATLDELESALRVFDGCGLKATAKNLCFYRGSARARLMIIGEAPGREEDLEGRPFVGRAGQLLDKMLAAIALGEGDVHITNVVYWRPPGNRTPTPQESQVCRPFLERQIELVAPDIVMLLGGAAAKQVLDTNDGIMRIRGKWRDVASGAGTIKTIATLHPAYLLRTPAAKRLAWRDLLAVQAALDG